METVILCSGRYANNPYIVKEEEFRLFSVEELCYYLYKNAFLLSNTFFSEELFDWLTTECQLKEWVEELRKIQKKSASLMDGIEYLFRKTGLFTEEEIGKVKKVLADSDHLSMPEKRKIRADAYFKRGLIAAAMQEYESLLKDVSLEDKKFRARLYHNLGVCHAFLFQYRKAAEEFKEAYQSYPNTETYVQFLCALKLSDSREAYLSYLSEHKESYEDSLEVERRISMVQKEWQNQKKSQLLSLGEDEDHYCEMIENLTRQAKKDYYHMVNQKSFRNGEGK